MGQPRRSRRRLTAVVVRLIGLAASAALLAWIATDNTTAITGGATWTHREPGAKGSFLVLTVEERGWPKALGAVVRPGFTLTTRGAPRPGAGDDAEARDAQSRATAHAAVIGSAWTAQSGSTAFPTPGTPDMGGLRGSSAGLTMALAAADRVVPVDLTGGLTVAATGTISPWGTVGAIGGVDVKAKAAHHAGADVMFVPVANLSEMPRVAWLDATEVPLAAQDFTAAGRAASFRRTGAAWRLRIGGDVMPVIGVRHTGDVLSFLCGATDAVELCDTARQDLEFSAAMRWQWMTDQGGKPPESFRQVND